MNKQEVGSAVFLAAFSAIALWIATRPNKIPGSSSTGRASDCGSEDAGSSPATLTSSSAEDNPLRGSQDVVETSSSAGVSQQQTPPGPSTLGAPIAVSVDGSLGGVFFSNPYFEPSQENFLALSGPLYAGLALTIGELRELEPAFWAQWPEYRYLLNASDATTVRECRGFEWIEPRRDLAEIWATRVEARQDFAQEQDMKKRIVLGMNEGADISVAHARMLALQDAAYSGLSREHLFLAHLSREATR